MTKLINNNNWGLSRKATSLVLSCLRRYFKICCKQDNAIVLSKGQQLPSEAITNDIAPLLDN